MHLPAPSSSPPVGAGRTRGRRPPVEPARSYQAPPPPPLGYGIVAPPASAGSPGQPPQAGVSRPPPPPAPDGRLPAYAPAPATAAYVAGMRGYGPPFVMAHQYGYGPPASFGYWRADTVWARDPRARGVGIRHSGADFLVALCTAATLVALWLPWYEVRFADSVGDSINLGQTSALGTGAGGWRFAIVIVAVVVLAYLAARVALSHRWPLPVPHFPLLLLLALGDLALVGIAFFQLPAGGVSVTSDGLTFGVTQAWGAYVGLAAAILAATAAIASRPKLART